MSIEILGGIPNKNKFKKYVKGSYIDGSGTVVINVNFVPTFILLYTGSTNGYVASWSADNNNYSVMKDMYFNYVDSSFKSAFEGGSAGTMYKETGHIVVSGKSITIKQHFTGNNAYYLIGGW